MGWESSDRREHLPSDWWKIVARVKDRDGGRCTWRLPSGKRCPRPGTDVDHKRGRDNHDLSNLQLLCRHHHDRKTQGEAAWGRRKKKPSSGKMTEKHPGLL